MDLAALDDITDIATLHDLMRIEIAKRDREITFKSAKIDQLTHTIAVLQRLQFSARAEKFDPTQQALFDTAIGADLAAAESELEQIAPPRERAQPKRQPLPESLPRVEERIEPASCICSDCGGALHQIGEDVSEKLDINPVENAIRPVALGRKNWLFAGSLLAGQRAANIMSLIQTAKANGHDPHAYLRDVLTRLPTQLNSRIGELLPHTWRPATA